MDILFADEKLARRCTEPREMLKSWGKPRAAVLRRRLDQLRAAECLEVMRSLPGRCHELKGDLAGKLALDLGHPFRLILEPANEPVQKLPDGGLDWNLVTTVRILEITDYHD
jgi:plasmid maintenance system killer protein